MTDPRFTDQRYSEYSGPHLSDPVLRRDEAIGGAWGWVAGLAMLALIGFIVIASWNSNTTASNNASPSPTGTATRTVTPPSTTGSGSTSPRPMTPAPAMPANSGK